MKRDADQQEGRLGSLYSSGVGPSATFCDIVGVVSRRAGLGQATSFLSFPIPT